MNTKKLQKEMLELIDKDGKSIGNTTLKEKFRKLTNIEDEESFWEIRNSLIDDGFIETGKGKGGSVHRILSFNIEKNIFDKGIYNERDLYQPFASQIKLWAENQGYSNIRVFITERRGMIRDTERWSKPDVTLIYFESFQYFPMQRMLNVVTFEIKPITMLLGGNWKEAVFETLSHSLSSNASYLAIHVPVEVQENFDDYKLEEIKELCNEFGLGLMIFSDPNQVDSYNAVLDATFKKPRLKNIEKFLKKLSHNIQTEIQGLL